MAYNSYNNFLNPIRQPNSSLFSVPTFNNNTSSHHKINQVPSNKLNNNLNKPINYNNYNNNNNKLVQPQHQNIPSYEHIPPHMINSNKRLELIKQEKDKLYQTLKDNEHLEQQLLYKSEQAIKLQQESEVGSIQSQIQILRKELEDKEAIEKQLNDKQIRHQILQERSDLSKIQEHKNSILDKIASQESHIIRLREKEERYRLEQEKELLSKQWEQMQLEKERTHQIELTKREANVRLERERIQLDEFERVRLRKETDDLKRLLEHKSNQESWLSRKLNKDTDRELTAEQIRTYKRQNILYKEKNGTINEISDNLYNNQDNSSNNNSEIVNNEIINNKIDNNESINSKKNKVASKKSIATENNTLQELSDGYQSDLEGFSDIDNIFNEPLFQRAKNENNSNIEHNNSKKVDPNDYELDKIDGLSSLINNNNNRNIKKDDDSLSTITHNSNNSDKNTDTKNDEKLDYSSLLNKLMKDMSDAKPKNKKQSEQLAVMLQACKTMSDIHNEDVQEEQELKDELRDNNHPHADVDIQMNPNGNSMIPSNLDNNSHLSHELNEIHKQMTDIKGILK